MPVSLLGSLSHRHFIDSQVEGIAERGVFDLNLQDSPDLLLFALHEVLLEAVCVRWLDSDLDKTLGFGWDDSEVWMAHEL